MKTSRAIIALLTLSLFLVTAAHTHAASDGDKGVRTVKLAVDGMCCASCLPDIEKSLTDISGVKSATASFDPPETTVTFDSSATDVSALIKAIAKVGYIATEKAADKAKGPKRS
ncbi:MAG: heavy-metal-associated domain-containing protein [Myxococcota bacterium]